MQMNMLNDFTLTQRQLAEIARQLLPGVQLLLFCRAGGIGGLSVVKRAVLLAASSLSLRRTCARITGTSARSSRV